MKQEDIDPVLKSLLEEADDDDAVEALVVVSPDYDEKHTSAAIGKIRDKTEDEAEVFDVFESIGVIRLKAKAKHIRDVLESDDVASASSTEGEVSID